MKPVHAITGAFGFTGRYIARRLLAQGETVITLTGRTTPPAEFAGAVRAFSFRFDSPEAMAESLSGATVLYNTYWVRFDRGGTTHDEAVARTRTLLRAAELAGVRRIVHVSITRPDAASPLPYFRGKALLEDAIRNSSLTHAILRPTVVFGPEDILINNIAYLLRHSPLFLIPGNGDYPIQPIFVEDLAQIAIDAARAETNFTIDAVGPETFTFDELVRRIAGTVGSHSAILHAPPKLALAAAQVLGALLHDVVLTADEVKGLTAGLLVSDAPPTGTTPLTNWLAQNAKTLGTHYASELRRHYPERGSDCGRP